MMNEEKFIDREVRIRMQEQNYIDLKNSIKDIHNLVRWILGSIVVAIIIPIGLRYFHLN